MLPWKRAFSAWTRHQFNESGIIKFRALKVITFSILRLNVSKYNCVSKDGQDGLFDLFTSLSFARTRFISKHEEIEYFHLTALMKCWCIFVHFLKFFFEKGGKALYHSSDFRKVRLCTSWAMNWFKLHCIFYHQPKIDGTYRNYMQIDAFSICLLTWCSRCSAYSPNLPHMVLCKHFTELIFF